MLTVNIETKGNARILAIDGEIDLYSSPQLRKELLAATEAKAPLIVVDLAKVGYMDSSGLATLIEALRQTSDYSGKLKLASLQSGVQDVFALSRLDKVFEIHESVDQALGSNES